MELSEARGVLVAIGGGDIKAGDAPLLKEFARLSKGPKARVVVLTVATDEPASARREYEAAFKQLGVGDVRTVDVSARSDAEDEKSLAAVERATGLFFTGGDQLHITSLLGGTRMQELIHKRYEKGAVVGGTSAGAAMMSNSMMLGGASDENPKLQGARIGPGMDLVVGALIDTHFSQRGRFGRLLTAVAHYPQDLGLGIDERTAMVVRRTEFEVMGEGAVTVIDAGAMTYTSLPDAEEEGEPLSLYNVRVHVIANGHRFDLARREPVVETKRALSKRAGHENDQDSGEGGRKGGAAKGGSSGKSSGKPAKKGAGKRRGGKK
jgi:cyanophycinase